MKSNRLASFLCWTAIVVAIFVIQIIYVILISDGVVMRRDLTTAAGRALVWSLFPLAIWGSIIKAKSKRESPEAPPAPTPLPPADTSPTPLPAPQKQPVVVQPIVQNSRITREPQPTPPIMKPDPEPKPSALPFIDDEPFYEEVAKELESDSMKPGLWTKAHAEADGDQERVKSIYIRLRVAQLLAAKEGELSELQRLENERIRAEEEAAKEEAARAEVARQEAVRAKAARAKAAELERKREEAEAEEERKREQEAAEERRREDIKRMEHEEHLRELVEIERIRKARKIDEIARKRVFERKQKEAAERAVARQKTRDDLMARVRLYLVKVGVISGVAVPLPEELKRSASSWDVHFGGLITDASRTGFVKRGRLRIKNGLIVIDGWKLFNMALRVVIGVVLACALMWALRSLDDRIGDQINASMGVTMQKLFAISFFEDLQQTVGPSWPFPDIWNFKGLFYIGVSICASVFISSYHLALRGSGTFVPVSRPKCRGRSVTMKIRPQECQKARHVCLRFPSHLDACVFHSHFEQST